MNIASSTQSKIRAVNTFRRIFPAVCRLTASCFCLTNSRVYLNSGGCHSAPQPTVRPEKTEVCNFSKHSGSATGAVGVLTYDVAKRGDKNYKEKIAIMFSVPHSYSFYQNWAAVGIYGKDRPTDESLYKEMYEAKKMENFARKEADGCNIMFEGKFLDVMCTMSPMGRAIMKVEVWDKIFCQTEQKQQW